MLSQIDHYVLNGMRELRVACNVEGIAETTGLAPDKVAETLLSLEGRSCIRRLPFDESKWIIEITDPEILIELRHINNPNREPTGHFTGRCMNCASSDLWTDETAYGCNYCRAVFFTGDIAPHMIENSTGRDLGSAW